MELVLENSVFVLFLLLVCAALYMRTRVLEERLEALDIALKAAQAERQTESFIADVLQSDHAVSAPLTPSRA